MSTTLSSAPRDAHLICDLLYSTLKLEEDDIRRIGVSERQIDYFLRSVAFAPELAVAYLLRKEALRRGVPIEGETKFDGCIVDCCLIEGGARAALCEIKGPRGVWQNKGPLRKDLQKLLRLSELTPVKRYGAWILVAENQSTPDFMAQWVRETAAGIAELDECAVSLPIPVNRTANGVTVWNEKRHECIWVIVFSLRR